MPEDYTPTPENAIREMAEEMINRLDPKARIADMNAGTGAIGAMLREVMPRCKLVGFEADKELHHELWSENKTTKPLVYEKTLHSNPLLFTTKEAAGAFDAIISRPPEAQAIEYVDYMLELASFNGDCPVFMLMEADSLFYQSPDWATWWTKKPLSGIRFLTNNALDGYVWLVFNAPGVAPWKWYRCLN